MAGGPGTSASAFTITRREPTTACHSQSVQFQVGLHTAHKFGVGRAVAPAQFKTQFAHGNGPAYAGDILHDALVIGTQQTEDFQTTVGILFVTCGRGFLAANDDIRGTQFLDLLLGPVADTFAHGHKPDDRTGANEDAKGSQAGPHLVYQQVLYA